MELTTNFGLDDALTIFALCIVLIYDSILSASISIGHLDHVQAVPPDKRPSGVVPRGAQPVVCCLHVYHPKAGLCSNSRASSEPTSHNANHSLGSQSRFTRLLDCALCFLSCSVHVASAPMGSRKCFGILLGSYGIIRSFILRGNHTAALDFFFGSISALSNLEASDAKVQKNDNLRQSWRWHCRHHRGHLQTHAYQGSRRICNNRSYL